TWAQLRKHVYSRGATRDDGLRTVALRLAAQTVLLMLVMLIVLEVILYFTTQQALVDSLKQRLQDRAKVSTATVCTIFHVRCPTLGPPGGPRGPGGPGGPGGQPPGSRPPRDRSAENNFDLAISDASVAFVDFNMRVQHADGLVRKVLDPAAVRRVLATHGDFCCSGKSYRNESYLVYTKSLSANGRIVGAAQTIISESQYLNARDTLLRKLVGVALLGLLISGGVSAILVQRALQPVRAAVRRQREFVADAAHELRTPLAIMRTVGEVGMADQDAEDLQATVAQMLGQNQHLTRLVDDLSLLARTDTNAMPLDRRPVNLSTLVSETSSELGFLAEEQGVALKPEIQPNLQVSGDTLRLRQLILILLDNALKHTPSGGVVRVLLSANSGRARLQVVDSGPGIAPIDLPHIFDRFYRADEARTGEGSGLGLAIGKWIVEAHSGHIQAGNAAPHGAVFTVVLPALRAAV
ncbi:MAG TPA: ATP-binding protein, partial [Chloroflexota bacterium]